MPHRAGGKTPGDHQEQTARRPIVATLEQSLDVNVSIDVAREQWARFVKWVLVGNYKFACDAFSCARAADSEIVDFRELEPGMTRVHVNLPYDDVSGGDAAARHALLSTHLYHDLMRFRQYVSENVGGKSKRVDAAAAPAPGDPALLFDETRPEQSSRRD
jgi:hypothetical protein